jgi:hypothetical protein
MMLVASDGDQGLDTGRLTGLDVLLAAVTAVGDQAFHGAEHLGLGLEGGQHRLDLLFIVGACVTPVATISIVAASAAAWALYACSKPPPATGMMRDSSSVRLI